MRKLILLCALLPALAFSQETTQVITRFGTFEVPTYTNSGTATRDSGPNLVVHSTSSSSGAFTPQSIVTSSGTYVVVPNYTTGRTQAIIQTSRGR